MNSTAPLSRRFLQTKFWRINSKNVVMKTLEWLAYSNVFTGLCAMSLVLMNYSFLNIPLESLHLVDIAVVGIFTMLGYQFPYTTAKRPVFATLSRSIWYKQHSTVIRLLVTVELSILLILLFYISFYKILILIAVAIVGCGYYGLLSYPIGNKKWRWRQYTFGKIGSICTVWLLLTIALPLADILHLLSINKILILSFMRLIFIAALCLIFDIRDITTDLELRLPTFATKLGIAHARTLVLVLAVFYFLVGMYFWQNFIIALLPIIIFIWTLNLLLWQRKARSELFYLLLVDGAMLIPYLIFIVIHLFYNVIIK